MQVICDRCGTEFDRYPYRVKERNFCSYKCHGEWRAENIRGENHPNWTGGKQEIECERCGTTLRRHEYAISERNFCDLQCQGEWISDNLTRENHPCWNGGGIEFECSWCGRTQKRIPSGIQEDGENFCDQDCYAAWQSENRTGENSYTWRGGYTAYYGPNWYIQRLKARKRDNYTCRSCGITEEELGRQLDVHHIVPFREFGLERYAEANEVLNLICYCTSCHGEKEPTSVLTAGVPMSITSKQVMTAPMAKRVVAQ